MTKETYLAELMNRYESEEDEFMRELEQMSHSIQEGETRKRTSYHREAIERDASNESDVPQDPQPILSVLCSLVDEIGTLRKENRRLKTRLALPPPRMNVIQRMSTLFDSRGITLPKMRRQAEVRIGARERLSTPPRKDPLTASSISTDFSYETTNSGGPKFRKPPIVQPEMTDSDVEDTAFDEPLSSSSSQRRRSAIRRRDLSISECTSPSSASSRDPSENMTSSRSSFFEFFGLKKRKEVITSVSDLLLPSRVLPRRKRKNSRENDDTTREDRQRRIKNRQSARFATEESEEDSAIDSKRKSASFLTAPYEKGKFEKDTVLRVDRETRLRHERDAIGAEAEELKTRNERLVEQLREKSALFSRLQLELTKSEREVDELRKKCEFNENLDRLSLQERFTYGHTNLLTKIEERLRQFETKLQTSRAEIAAQQQAAHRAQSTEQTSFQSMVEQVERVQRENLRLTKKCLQECHIDEASLKRKISLLPSYDALYSFSMGMVRKLSELRTAIHVKSCDLSRAELDLMAAQSSLLVTHAQIERLRLQLSICGKKTRRAASFHGEDLLEKTAKKDLHFLLPFKLQGSRLDNLRRQNRKQQSHGSSNVDSERALEHEFLKLFGYAQCLAQVCDRPKDPPNNNHYDAMMREIQATPSVRQRQRAHGPGPGREREAHRRPISLVELEERRQRVIEEQRRSVLVKVPDKRVDGGGGLSLQDVSSPPRSPLATPRAIRKKLLTNMPKLPDSPVIGESREKRERRLEKQRSIDVEVLRRSELRRQLSIEKPPCEPRQSLDRKPRVVSDNVGRNEVRNEPQPVKDIDSTEERRKDEGSRVCRLQRSAPVSRMRPPHATFRARAPGEPQPTQLGLNNPYQSEHLYHSSITNSTGYRAVNRPSSSNNSKTRPSIDGFHQNSSSIRHPSPPIPPFSIGNSTQNHGGGSISNSPGRLSPSQPISRLPKPEKKSWIERLKHIKK